jgi:FkbM family methyltransferase
MFKRLSHFFGSKKDSVISDNTQEMRLYEKSSFSQCGEDLIIDYIFRLRGVTHPTFLDIGAHHPWFINNTAIFYLRGCRGVNIEPNPSLYKRFTEERAEDTNLNIGIADGEGEMDFFIMGDNTLSTMSSEELDHLLKCGHTLVEKIKINTRTVASVVDEFCNGKFPDLLTLDTEGYDLNILESIDYDNNCPKIICVESVDYSTTGSGAKRVDLINYVVNCGYYLYADTNLNSILVHNNFWTGNEQ